MVQHLKDIIKINKVIFIDLITKKLVFKKSDRLVNHNHSYKNQP